jgi:hypothetical protein
MPYSHDRSASADDLRVLMGWTEQRTVTRRGGARRASKAVLVAPGAHQCLVHRGLGLER